MLIVEFRDLEWFNIWVLKIVPFLHHLVAVCDNDSCQTLHFSAAEVGLKEFIIFFKVALNTLGIVKYPDSINSPSRWIFYKREHDFLSQMLGTAFKVISIVEAFGV